MDVLHKVCVLMIRYEYTMKAAGHDNVYLNLAGHSSVLKRVPSIYYPIVFQSRPAKSVVRWYFTIVASFDKEVNPRLAKRPLKTNAR